MNIDEYLNSMNRIGETLRASTGWIDSMTQQMNFVNKFNDAFISNAQLQTEALMQSARLIAESPTLRALENQQALISNTMIAQIEILSQISNQICTPELEMLQQSIRMANPMAGLEEFLFSISKSYTVASNISFLCGLDLNAENMRTCPKGTYSFVRRIKKRTGKQLSKDETIEVSLEEKAFRSAKNTDAKVDVKSMNVIASSTEVFSGLREGDLIDFISFISGSPELALEHPVGIAIHDIILEWHTYMDFDKDVYYHARPMKDTRFPYTADEMGSAPNIYVSAGRYNHTNQSHYYFADTVEGAKEEIRKHYPKSTIQVARLKPIKDVRLVDLSGGTTPYNSFFQLIRMPVSDKNKPTEYLLPEFVTSCCKSTKIEGIKYYGGPKYNNYVTWNDGYFAVELLERQVQ